ncbi:MAG TPA: aminopeptidase [Candidatus Merdenecus merdavium]|nr:aminopeptidase [Candidatus Merdenecus merdavium]
MLKEETVNVKYREFFRKTASFMVLISDIYKRLIKEELMDVSMDELQKINQQLYEDIIEENYEHSYANPAYAVKMLGEGYGKPLSLVYSEIRGMIAYAYEYRLYFMTIHQELFIQLYNLFEDQQEPKEKEIKEIIYLFLSDYCDVIGENRIKEQYDPQMTFAKDIIMESDLKDLRYLYRYGEYVSQDQLDMAEYLNTLPQTTIDQMADTFTDGYIRGFALTGRDLSKKETVNIRYVLGFEKMIKKAIINFEQAGLKPILTRSSVQLLSRRAIRIGYYGGIPNKQFDYDHKDDLAYVLDGFLNNRRLEVLKAGLETYKEEAKVFAGPAVVETFGGHPFIPKVKEEVFSLSEKQQKLSVEYGAAQSEIINEYLPGEELSFTIIAFPTPEIGENFKEIFHEVIGLNTLDHKIYTRIQQKIIDVLDESESVEVLGSNGNQTNMVVSFMKLTDPKKQTKFENCTADVNIPVGEVFTSPVLKGTNGTLHVKQVFLNELDYKDLTITFEQGMIKEYTCKNFESEEENQKYVKENLLFHRDTLPLGEFAIGTNTTAYMVSQKFGLGSVLPILITEKMGPHFAVGDTCYKWSEDVVVYNPDGKEIVAKDNEISKLRLEDPSKAYFQCHTDITIPYGELGSIKAVKGDGSKVTIIENGRFVLPGTEELNKPLEELDEIYL